MKTALVLGGGGARGAYEIGVWQALQELDIEPDIVTGTSVGAINGAVIVQNAFDLAVNLWKEISTPMVVDIGKPRKEGSQLKELLGKYLDEEKIRARGIDFGLATVELPVPQARHFFLEDIPKGQLLDYVVASASLFPAIKMADIGDTKFVDGGYLDNLPVGMALERGAKKIIAVDLETSGLVQKVPLKEAEDLTMISCQWDLGEVMIFDGKDSPRKMRLGYLDTMKAFGIYHGKYYALAKGSFNKKDLEGAELAGKIFGLDPEKIYTKESFLKALEKAVTKYEAETREEVHNFQNSIKNLKPDKDSLISLLKKLNDKSITLAIAQELRENPKVKDHLLAKPVALLFKEESKAANYLVKQIDF